MNFTYKGISFEVGEGHMTVYRKSESVTEQHIHDEIRAAFPFYEAWARTKKEGLLWLQQDKTALEKALSKIPADPDEDCLTFAGELLALHRKLSKKDDNKPFIYQGIAFEIDPRNDQLTIHDMHKLDFSNQGTVQHLLDIFNAYLFYYILAAAELRLPGTKVSKASPFRLMPIPYLRDVLAAAPPEQHLSKREIKFIAAIKAELKRRGRP